MLGSLVMEGQAEVASYLEGHEEIVRSLLGIVRHHAQTSVSNSTADERSVNLISLLEAVLRTLRSMTRIVGPHRSLAFEPENLKSLVLLLRENINSGSLHRQNICQYASSVLTNSCDSETKQKALLQASVHNLGANMLGSSAARTVEAALDLLAVMCRENTSIASAIVSLQLNGTPLALNLFELCGSSQQRPEVKLLASVLLTNLHRCRAFSGEQAKDVTRILLPALTALLEEHGLVQVRAPLVLAFLLGGGEESLQLAALGCNAVGRLAALLNAMESSRELNRGYGASGSNGAKRQVEQAGENALIALAALTANRDECRKLVIETPGLLRTAVRLLDSPIAGLRSAACQCIRSLSRSVKNLRTHLVDAGLVQPVVRLLASPQEEAAVRTAACATLCNLVLDFSPMKAAVLESGAVVHFIRLLTPGPGDRDTGLRLNAIWAIKNLLYMADATTKRAVLQHLSFDILHVLCNDTDRDIQSQALNILRNLACGDEGDILQLLQGFGLERLLNLLTERMGKGSRKDAILQALYVVVNVATGGNMPRDAIMASAPLLDLLRHHILTPIDDEIRLAAIWCVINLTWPDDQDSGKRVSTLRGLGFEDALRRTITSLPANASIDLNDRAALALEHFTESFHRP